MNGESSQPLVEYRRAGGRAPADDEWLRIEADGSFRARRTVGGRAIGAFAGRLDSPAVDAIRAAADGLKTGDDLDIPTPIDGATETFAAAGRVLRTGSNAQPPEPWTGLALRLRAELDEIVASPRAALELRADAGSATLAHAGVGPVEIDAATVVVRAVRLDADGLVLGRWQGRVGEAAVEDAAEPAESWVTAAPGWRLDLPFGHGLELAPTDWLQVWVFLRMRGDTGDDAPVGGGRARACRLFVAVSGSPALGGSGNRA